MSLRGREFGWSLDALLFNGIDFGALTSDSVLVLLRMSGLWLPILPYDVFLCIDLDYDAMSHDGTVPRDPSPEKNQYNCQILDLQLKLWLKQTPFFYTLAMQRKLMPLR